MTREEAIERLSIHKSTDVWIDSIAEAIDMAIEALERENHDGCDGCMYEHYEELTEPCYSCKQNYTDRYMPEPKHDRDWIVGCIEHDGFIKTDRGDKANQIILEALKADRPMVIKCKPFLSEEDFKAFAEQVSDQNVILISCEAEVVSTNTSTKSTNISTDTSADTVEVVRCKDCKYFDEELNSCKRRGGGIVHKDAHFCAYGERREE